MQSLLNDGGLQAPATVTMPLGIPWLIPVMQISSITGAFSKNATTARGSGSAQDTERLFNPAIETHGGPGGLLSLGSPNPRFARRF
jgi:hypothetical protein